MRRLAAAVAMVGTLGGAGATGAGREADVAVRLFQFRPAEVTVAAGGRVTWRNGDDITHTVTAGTPEGRDAAFDLVMDGAGRAVMLTPAAPGTYPYFCARHPHMRGVVRVE
jgi:plastocyanin